MEKEITLRAIMDNYREGAEERNTDKFLRFYHDDVIVFDAFGQEIIKSKDEFRVIIEKWFASTEDEGGVNVGFSDITLTEGDKTFGAVFIARFSKKDGSRSIINRFTWIVSEIDSEYKIVHEHSSVPAKDMH